MPNGGMYSQLARSSLEVSGICSAVGGRLGGHVDDGDSAPMVGRFGDHIGVALVGLRLTDMRPTRGWRCGSFRTACRRPGEHHGKDP